MMCGLLSQNIMNIYLGNVTFNKFLKKQVINLQKKIKKYGINTIAIRLIYLKKKVAFIFLVCL